MAQWGNIYKTLKASGIPVFSPGVKEGECTEAYVVVKTSGSNQHVSFSSDIVYYDIMCYVPKTEYSTLEGFIDRVKAAMKELEPVIKQAGQETSSFYDDTYKAHMSSIKYKNYKKS